MRLKMRDSGERGAVRPPMTLTDPKIDRWLLIIGHLEPQLFSTTNDQQPMTNFLSCTTG